MHALADRLKSEAAAAAAEVPVEAWLHSGSPTIAIPRSLVLSARVQPAASAANPVVVEPGPGSGHGAGP